MRVLMIFIDGFGLGLPDPRRNPYLTAATPNLDAVLGGHLLLRRDSALVSPLAVMVPTDATLGVEGIPQSATGQTSLWTGLNAPQIIGGHLRGFPNDRLKDLISRHGIHQQVLAGGRRAVFANAFRPSFFTRPPATPVSCSTWMALSAGLHIHDFDDLRRGRAVYQDITNETIAAKTGLSLPLVTPEEAGRRLAAMVPQSDFTLYEYFNSDVTGHQSDWQRALEVYRLLDAFLGAVINELDLADTLLVITSDHGNLEDVATPLHTLNPVPTICLGARREEALTRVASISDITPWLVDLVAGS